MPTDAPDATRGRDHADGVGVIVVDHGSRRAESNVVNEALVRAWATGRPYVAVEAAHMELAEPSIGTAFDACVAAGANTVIVAPYFLGPGRHWDRDIPALTAQAATRHPGIRYLVSAPLGPDPRLMDLLEDRFRTCTAHADGTGPGCGLCAGTDRCRIL